MLKAFYLVDQFRRIIIAPLLSRLFLSAKYLVSDATLCISSKAMTLATSPSSPAPPVYASAPANLDLSEMHAQNIYTRKIIASTDSL
jgi:hypothetical protein